MLPVKCSVAQQKLRKTVCDSNLLRKLYQEECSLILSFGFSDNNHAMGQGERVLGGRYECHSYGIGNSVF